MAAAAAPRRHGSELSPDPKICYFLICHQRAAGVICPFLFPSTANCTSSRNDEIPNHSPRGRSNVPTNTEVDWRHEVTPPLSAQSLAALAPLAIPLHRSPNLTSSRPFFTIYPATRRAGFGGPSHQPRSQSRPSINHRLGFPLLFFLSTNLASVLDGIVPELQESHHCVLPVPSPLPSSLKVWPMCRSCVSIPPQEAGWCAASEKKEGK